MKTDSIFYRIFQTLPESFFELLNLSANEAKVYDFASVELKQTAFRIDGVFLPTINQHDKPIYFVEVQFQKDIDFYARFFSEIFLYLRLYASTKPWRSVVIFAKRSIEPTEIETYRFLLESPFVTRLYLDELDDNLQESLGIGIIKLVVENEKRIPELTRNLLIKANSELADEVLQKNLLDLIQTIVSYKLPRLSPQELAKMFSISDLRNTRYYQEVRYESELNLVMRQLERRIGGVSQELQVQVNKLSVEDLENLGLELLDFTSEADLVAWLKNKKEETM
ncbi:MAG TPA: Rpn family recombination-promoting nuclease/putative transposase [Nostocaceae cyanobacterium]|nr:Rpn family recombination-promoting nuclease/putative transposase [Nostocaceae cyanobacterium]